MVCAELHEVGYSRCEDWMMARYVEVRKLVKAALKRYSLQHDWFDMLLSLRHLVHNFNAASAQTLALCVSDLTDRFVLSKSLETVDSMMDLVKDRLTNSN